MKIHCLLFLASAALLSAQGNPPRPNIILAMADDMGWGDPSCYSEGVTFANGTPHPDQGWIQTPVIDAMADNGLRFNRFYAASAVCSPTRASCLTGRNPFRVGVPFANQGRLGFDETPLSEILSAEGYRCGHFGKWHLGTCTTLRPDSNRGGDASVYSAPWHHGYDTCFVTESKVPTYHPYRITNNSAALPTSFTDSNFYGTYYWRMPATWNELSGEGIRVPVNEVNNAVDGDDSKLIVDEAIAFIDDAVSNNEPFFLVLWFHTPHKPMVDPQGSTAIDSSDALRDSIEDMDAAIGTLRNRLTTLGVRDDTMFWLTSDNGPENNDDSFNEVSTTRSIRSGRYLQRKRSLHEGGVRVPGILEWPNQITSSRVTEYPAVTSDYYPTILDYLELSVPEQKPLDGVSLRPLIEDTVSTRSQPIGFKINAHRSWVTQQYKLIDSGSGWELFDLENIAAGEEVEETALATSANIGSQSAAIQTIYNDLLDEFTAWEASVNVDSAYPHDSRPTTMLTTSATEVDLPFAASVTFSESVNQLQDYDFVIENGTLSALSGSAGSYTFTITPDSGVEYVIISLPAGAAFDGEGNPSLASNELGVGDLPPVAGQPISVDIDFGSVALTPGFYNNVNSTGSFALVDDTGASTGIQLNLTSGVFAGSGANYDGPYPTEVAAEPQSALQDSLFIRTTPSSGTAASMVLSNLVPAATYDLTIYGARGNNGLETFWTVTDNDGQQVESVSNVFNNATEVVTFTDLAPTAGGVISIDMTSAESTSSGAAMNYMNLTSTGDIDSDGDGMLDAYEQANGTNPNVDDASGDLDMDGLTNLQEYLGQDASDQETGFGQTLSGTADLDGDGLNDGDELLNGANPFVSDTDGDGYNDAIEVAKGSLPSTSGSVPNLGNFATIDWMVQEFDSVSLLSNEGQLVFAENYGGGELTVNGITFVSMLSDHVSKSSANLATLLTETAVIDLYDDEVPELSPLLESFWWKGGSTTVTMGILGLTSGSTYEVQMGRADDRNAGSILGRYAFADDLYGNNGGAPVGPDNTIYGGSSAPALLFTGTFVADCPIQVFSTGHRLPNGSVSGSQISFMQLRELVYEIDYTSIQFVGTDLVVDFVGMAPTKTYQMTRSVDLENFDVVVDGPRAVPGESDAFVDSDPPADRAFYRLEEVSP